MASRPRVASVESYETLCGRASTPGADEVRGAKEGDVVATFDRLDASHDAGLAVLDLEVLLQRDGGHERPNRGPTSQRATTSAALS
jgi:hypothetical protein